MSSLIERCSCNWARTSFGCIAGGSASRKLASMSRNHSRSSSMSVVTSLLRCLLRWRRSALRWICSTIASYRRLSRVTRLSMVPAPSPGEIWHNCGPTVLMASRTGRISSKSLSNLMMSVSRGSPAASVCSATCIQSTNRRWDSWNCWTRGKVSWARLRKSPPLVAKSP